jgi:hypothetical protein
VLWFNVAITNIGSFVLGFFVCKWLARRAAAAVDHIHDHSEVTMPARRSALMPLPARVIVLVLVGALTFGLGVRVGYEVLAGKVSCFNDYANKNADSQETRQAATEALQNADAKQDRAIAAALSPGATADDFALVRQATAAKIAKQHELATQRRINPYPDAPREVC